jgi:hypothetical protein
VRGDNVYSADDVVDHAFALYMHKSAVEDSPVYNKDPP